MGTIGVRTSTGEYYASKILTFNPNSYTITSEYFFKSEKEGAQWKAVKGLVL